MADMPKLPRWIKEQRIVVVDLETTGQEFVGDKIKPRAGSIVEIAATTAWIHPVRGTLMTHSWTSQVKPFHPILDRATAIHGMTNASLSEEPTFHALAPLVHATLDGAIVVAYNGLRFDFPVLVEELRTAGFRWKPKLVIDPLVLVKEADRFVKGPGRYKLTKVAERWGVPVKDAHVAANDVEMTLGILVQMFTGATEWFAQHETGAKFVAWQRGLADAQEKDFASWRKKVKRA